MIATVSLRLPYLLVMQVLRLVLLLGRLLRAKLDADEDDSLCEHASGWCVEPWWSR